MIGGVKDGRLFLVVDYERRVRMGLPEDVGNDLQSSKAMYAAPNDVSRDTSSGVRCGITPLDPTAV